MLILLLCLMSYQVEGSIAAALIIGLMLNALFPGETILDFASSDWEPVPENQCMPCSSAAEH